MTSHGVTYSQCRRWRRFCNALPSIYNEIFEDIFVYTGINLPVFQWYLMVVWETYIFLVRLYTGLYSLRWRHNDHAGVSNHQPHGCLLNRLFRRNSKKTSKLRVTGLCAGNSPGTGEFPAQMASYAENVSIWWRHHGCLELEITWTQALKNSLFETQLNTTNW